jgi:RNA-directed DNA polymerase
MSKEKSFNIPKQAIWIAYERVKANKGASGVDGETIKDFEKDLKNNLYKIWNRMSSGSYIPPPVKTVVIPKKEGGERILGIPTVADRIAQTVAKIHLEPILEPIFHEDSYGYRPNRSAHDAVAAARKRCWDKSWVLDLDIKGFFDNIDHELMMKAVKHHTDSKWLILYIERWLKAGVMARDGLVRSKVLGTPQGGVISPLLANLFLHYAFDAWIKRQFPHIKFERYADDIVIHCATLGEAKSVKSMVARRLNACNLELHPEKTKIVFCREKQTKVPVESYPTSFDFLGFTFRKRTTKAPNGELFDVFLPAISRSALKKIRQQIKKWKVTKASDLSLQELSHMYNPTIRGWINYYAKFYPQGLKTLWKQWRMILSKWALRKYLRRFNGHRQRAARWIYDIECREPNLFAIWQLFHKAKT